MLRTEENDLACRVGKGTPMGDLMRRYWLPAMLSSELPRPDCPPVRVLLLGERLIAFRDSAGRVGLLANHCPHRGASLFYGRNQEGGLRCVYHGWKFDAGGACVDMPSEPPDSNFKQKVRATAYPCQERGGIIWAYLGPLEQAPPLPDLEANQLPEGEWDVSAVQRECNWLQGLEGDIDTSHFGFLHFGSTDAEETEPDTFQYYTLKDRAPRYSVLDTEYGTTYGAYRPARPGTLYWRIAHFLFPFYAMIPTGVLGHQILARAWVPMDDTHTMWFGLHRQAARQPEPEPEPEPDGTRRQRLISPLLPNTSGWYGRFRLQADEHNDYNIDREWQRDGDYTGIEGIFTQDQAITESMGPIFDRTQEHLASSDAMVIRVRRRLIRAAEALAERGEVPPGAEDPTVYRQRSGGIILDENEDWIEATKELRKAYVPHPELDPAVAGRP